MSHYPLFNVHAIPHNCFLAGRLIPTSEAWVLDVLKFAAWVTVINGIS